MDRICYDLSVCFDEERKDGEEKEAQPKNKKNERVGSSVAAADLKVSVAVAS